MINRSLMLVLALVGGTALGAAGPAQAGFKISDLDLSKLPEKVLPVLTKAKVNVHNNYKFAITVTMDNGREKHKIAAGGVATFTKANKGDKPTFRAINAKGAEIKSKSIFLDGNKTLNFG